MARLLVACEYSGIVREAFTARGWDAWSCDLLPTEIPGNHIQGNVLEIIDDGWDLMIAHPPCTYLCNSGVQHLYTDRHKENPLNIERWRAMEAGALFFRQLLEADIPRIAIENPVMHKYARSIVGARFTQSVQPWQFGHGECKRTCFWLKNLSCLTPTEIVTGREQRMANIPPSATRGHERSRTYSGIAAAMAQQWGTPEGQVSDLPLFAGVALS